MGVTYNIGAISACVASGFVADAIGRRKFLIFTYAGCLITSVLAYTWSGSLETFMVIAFLNGAFTLGFSFSWMAIYLAELFTSSVRATASSFVFNGARLIAWIFPIIAGQIVTSLGGVASAALIMSSVYVIGLVVPWLMPETAGKPLPEESGASRADHGQYPEVQPARYNHGPEHRAKADPVPPCGRGTEARWRDRAESRP